jgi:hypothetical protein
MMSEFGFAGVERDVFLFTIPSVGAAVGAITAGYMASTRAIRMPAVAAIALTAILLFFGTQGAESLISAVALVSLASALASALLVFAAITLVQGVGAGLPLALGVVLAAPLGIYLVPDVFGIDLFRPELFFALFGACAVAAFLWGPSVSPVYRRQMAYAPVGPAPISMRGEPSRTPLLILLIAAAAVAGSISFRSAASFSGNEVYELQSYAALVPIGVGLAIAVAGEASALRLVAFAGLAALAWLGFGEGDIYLPALLVYFAGHGWGALADFSAVLLGARYGQPADAAKRIGVLFAAQSLTYPLLNLWLTLGRPGGGDPWPLLLTGLGASALALLLFLQLPRFRSPAAAW